MLVSAIAFDGEEIAPSLWARWIQREILRQIEALDCEMSQNRDYVEMIPEGKLAPSLSLDNSKSRIVGERIEIALS